jgi:hypothetical protein
MFLKQLHITLYLSNRQTYWQPHSTSFNTDKGENLGKAPCDRKPVHLENLVKAICSCGVSFSVWENRMQMVKEVVSMTSQV